MTSHPDPNALAYMNGPPAVCGQLRMSAEDFFVVEELGFQPDGEGEHVLLYIEKRNTNTDWLARQLARLAGVRSMDVSYAGLKDRNAQTRQWFSIYLPSNKSPDWLALETNEITILSESRHRRKLRRGCHRGNHFVIGLRELQGDLTDTWQRLEQIRNSGVPNYFGPQRFGHGGANLDKAQALLSAQHKVKDRQKRGLYLSAARAFLFNQVLSQRVSMANWDTPVAGDVMLLDGTGSFFSTQTVSEEILLRTRQQDIHPSGPLWGQGESSVALQARQIEQSALQAYAAWCEGLAGFGLKQDRRSLRLPVRELTAEWKEDEALLRLAFFLPRGAFATSVVRELVDVRSAEDQVRDA